MICTSLLEFLPVHYKVYELLCTAPHLYLSGEVLSWLSVWSEVQMIAYGPADATAT